MDVPDPVIIAGLNVQPAFAGNPVQANVICAENPVAPVTLIGALTDLPDCTVSVVLPSLPGERAKAASITWLTVAEDAWGIRIP